MNASDDETIEAATSAAHASSSEAAAAISRAAEKNEDPGVAEDLELAAVAAEQTNARIGWVRSALRRLFGRSD